MSISVVLPISRAVDLRYPVRACLESAISVASEFIVGVDTSVPDDGTMALVSEIGDSITREYRIPFNIRPVHWNHDNRVGGTEVCIQTNLLITEARSNWVLSLQADEVLHEDDTDEILYLARSLPQRYAGVEFNRLYFWGGPDILRTDWTMPLVRMMRRGRGQAVEDAMSCEVNGEIWPLDRDAPLRLFHYSRCLGSSEDIARRVANNDTFHHDPSTVQFGRSYDFGLWSVDSFAEGVEKEAVPASVLVSFTDSHPRVALRHILNRESSLDTAQDSVVG